MNWRDRLFLKYFRSPNHPMKLRLANWLRAILCIPKYEILCNTAWNTVMKVDQRDLVQRAILYLGKYEALTSTCLLDQLTPGSVFVDVGAHVGYYTLAAASKVGTSGKVIAVEPNPRTFVRLRENLLLNPDIQNVTLCLCAASESTDILSMSWPPESNWGLSSTALAEDAHYKIVSTPLATLLKNLNIRRVDVMKVDVESHELSVLRGMKEFDLPTHLFLEMNSPDSPKSRELIESLTALKYQLFGVDGQKYEPGKELLENNLWARQK